jgi:hypothetical protein
MAQGLRTQAQHFSHFWREPRKPLAQPSGAEIVRKQTFAKSLVVDGDWLPTIV